jgi:capsular polysaccharide transport system permease protein
MTPPPEDRAAAAPRPLRAVAPPEVASEPVPGPAQPPGPEAEPVRRRRRRGLQAVPDAVPVRRRRPAAKPEPPKPEEPPAVPAPPPARAKPRHWALAISFALLVLAPFAASVWYLYARAADQYHSVVAFSIRSEESTAAAAGLLGALTQIGTGTASDPNILFEFIDSQEIVEEIDAEIDLRAIYRRPASDPLFTLGPDPSIEALLAAWRRMVEVSYDSNAGIIHVRANAFTPDDARAIAAAILERSGELVNRLSEQAREDAVRFARAELAEAEANVHAVRERLADFRRANRIVDPSADAAGQMGLLNALQTELAQALVDRDVLLSYADPDDPRVAQINRRIEAIGERIEAERASLGITAGEAGSLPEVLGAYEELQVDMEFANTAYTQALAGLAGARAEARRQSRYLAPHIQPTLAERALYPRRPLLAGLTGLFLLLGWGIALLVYYNVRDSR